MVRYGRAVIWLSLLSLFCTACEGGDLVVDVVVMWFGVGGSDFAVDVVFVSFGVGVIFFIHFLFYKLWYSKFKTIYLMDFFIARRYRKMFLVFLILHKFSFCAEVENAMLARCQNIKCLKFFQHVEKV